MQLQFVTEFEVSECLELMLGMNLCSTLRLCVCAWLCACAYVRVRVCGHVASNKAKVMCINKLLRHLILKLDVYTCASSNSFHVRECVRLCVYVCLSVSDMRMQHIMPN